LRRELFSRHQDLVHRAGKHPRDRQRPFDDLLDEPHELELDERDHEHTPHHVHEHTPHHVHEHCRQRHNRADADSVGHFASP
jgi:hypothetical protein